MSSPLLHKLWSLAVGQPGYNKEDWKALEAMLEEEQVRGRRAEGLAAAALGNIARALAEHDRTRDADQALHVLRGGEPAAAAPGRWLGPEADPPAYTVIRKDKLAALESLPAKWEQQADREMSDRCREPFYVTLGKCAAEVRALLDAPKPSGSGA